MSCVVRTQTLLTRPLTNSLVYVCASRWIHAAGLQRERERAIQTLPRENLQEDGESYRKQLSSSMYVLFPLIYHRVGEKPRFLHLMCFCWLSSVSFKVCVLVTSDPEVHEIAFMYGKNVGIAFQVISIVSAWICFTPYQLKHVSSHLQFY